MIIFKYRTDKRRAGQQTLSRLLNNSIKSTISTQTQLKDTNTTTTASKYINIEIDSDKPVQDQHPTHTAPKQPREQF